MDTSSTFCRCDKVQRESFLHPLSAFDRSGSRDPEVPTAVPSIDGRLLDPRSCWADANKSGCLDVAFKFRHSVGAAWRR